MPPSLAALCSFLVATAPVPAMPPRNIVEAVAALKGLKAEQVVKGPYESTAEFQARQAQAKAALQSRIDMVVGGTYPGSGPIGFLRYDADLESFRADLFILNRTLYIRIPVPRAQAPSVEADFKKVAAQRPQQNSGVEAKVRFWIEPDEQVYLLGEGTVQIGKATYKVRPAEPAKVRILRTLKIPDARPPIAFSALGVVMASRHVGQRQDVMSLWDFKTGRLLRVVELAETNPDQWEGKISFFVVDPRGQWVAPVTGSSRNVLRVFDVESGKMLTMFKKKFFSAKAVDASDDGKAIRITEKDGSISVLDPLTGSMLGEGEANAKQWKFDGAATPVAADYQDVSRRLPGATPGPLGAGGQSRWFGFGDAGLSARADAPKPGVTLVEFKPVPENQVGPGGAP